MHLMIRWKFFSTLFFYLTLALVMGACVPKASEKKAVCGTNQAFDSVTRSCYSIAEIRYKPTATKTSETLAQEVSEVVTLTYTDKNKDQATSCKVTSISSNLEVMSPAIVNGGLFTKALEVADAAEDLADAVYALDPIKVTVMTAASNMAQALADAQASYSYATIVSKIGVFKAHVNNIVGLTASQTNTSVQFFNNLTQTRLATLNPLITFVENRCECSAGVCSATLVPKINQTGAGGFTYTITDADGESDPKAVTTTITAMAATTTHLKPVAESSYEILSESNTSVATNYSVGLPGGADLFGSTSFTYAFNGSKNGSNQGLTSAGKVWGCMDLAGSSGTADTSCTYAPDDGDAFDSNTVEVADATIGDLTFEALNPGSYGNSITLQYFNVQNNLASVDALLTKTQLFGMISTTYNESFIRVVGNAIKIFINPGITSSADIRDLVNAHPQAMKLVLASGGATSTFPVPATETPAAIALSGGVDGFDKISFFINNSQASSTNAANIMIKVVSTDDVAVMNFVASAASTDLEDTDPIVIDLSATYSDVDTDGITYTNTCNVDPLDAVFLANFTVNSCTCVAAVCSISLTPDADVSNTSAFSFAYRIGSFNGVTTQYTAYRNYSLSLTPINDAPELSSVALPTITALADQTIAESTSTVANSGFVDIYVGPGGSGFETSQTLTLTAESSDDDLLPDANLVVTTPSAGVRRLTYTPALNKSGSTTITVTLRDDGGTDNGGDEETQDTFDLTVTPVNDPPYYVSPFLVTVDTNEGGAVQSAGFYLDEDYGSSSDEDAQAVTISAIDSDNETVLPDSSVTIFYDLNDNGVEDSGELRALGATLEDAAGDDVKLHKVYLKLSPINGVAGNSNVKLTITDGTTSVDKTFSFVVHPIAALHGGWANISAVGIKTDKKGNPVSEAEMQCNFNETTDTKKCSIGGVAINCTYNPALTTSTYKTSTQDSPHGLVVPDEANVIYYDSSNKRCYRSTGSTEFSWVELKTTCPITRESGVCSDNNCISSSVPTPSFIGQYHYDSDNGACSVSFGTGPADWESFVPSKVTLTWKPFIITGSGADSGVQIAGWNVYRREAGTDYDFNGGHLQNSTSTSSMTITSPSVYTFQDTTAIAGKVYYYLVRPVDNRRNIPTYTPEIYSEVRVLAPTPNYSFVHRWMINQEICNSMNMTTTTTNKVDPSNNFRCPYYGLGDPAETGYYDFGKDLLVDTQEMGCAYAAAPKCSADGCIGIGAPTSTSGGVTTNDLYYDRSTGSCYLYDGGWVDFGLISGAQITAVGGVAKFNTALNAPLVNLPFPNAMDLCTARGDQASLYSGLDGAIQPEIPTKEDFMAYSAHPSTLSDTAIGDLEQGLSLNLQSACNGSSASGLEAAFTDSNIPSTSFIYTLPGTAASGIRSLFTGSIPVASSKSTESCVSRYGIQDLYGNVAEWTQDLMTCDGTFVCSAMLGSINGYDFDPTVATRRYALDLVTGPYNDQDADATIGTAGDAHLTDWAFADELFDATKFSFPLGLPISSNITSVADIEDSPAVPFLLDIGPSSGITTSKLHDDAFIVNGQTVDDGSGIGAFAVGGSYLSGARAGRYTSELVPEDTVRPDVGFRCIVPVIDPNYPDAATSNHNYPY